MHRSIIVLAVGFTGCGSPEPEGEGPPEILQVLARERGADGELVPRLAHGDHDDVGDDDDREVGAAVADGGQRIRVVFDELLRGNHLEEIPCADGTWTRVPVGMDFDDVARCAGADLGRCEGLCLDHGGIRDDNGDGAFDDTRLIAGAVTVTCDGEAVELDVQRSFYQPSGNQVMSSAGIESLGPAVVLAPADGLPPGSTCGIGFDASVVDKQGEPVGDTGEVGFTVEPFLVAASRPADGAADVEPTDPGSPDATIVLDLNARLDPASAAAITLTAAGTPVAIEPVVDGAAVTITVPGGFAAATEHALALDGLTDVYGDVLAASITWSTR